MKKRLICYLALVLLAVFALGGLIQYGMLSQTEITVREETLSGDVAAAKGLSLTLEVQKGAHLFWTTSFSAEAQPAPTTNFTYSLQGIRQPSVSTVNFSSGSLNGGLSTSLSHLLEESGNWSDLLIEPVREIAATLEPGETQSKIVAVADYWENYPMFLQLSMPDTGYYYDDNGSDFLTTYFQIPVPEDLYVSVSVSLGADGEDISSDVQPLEDLEYDFLCDGMVRGEWIYLSLSAASSANRPDFSHIRDGYGIYRIPVPQVDETTLNLEAIENILPFSAADTEAVALEESPWEGILEIFTVENGRLRLRLLDEATCAVVEDYWLDADEIPAVVQNEDVLVLLFWDAERCRFLAYARENGYYVPWLSSEMPQDNYFWYGFTPAFDGTHLALTYSLGEHSDVSAGLQVYDREGLAYHGRFISSADSPLVWLNTYNPPALRWD